MKSTALALALALVSVSMSEVHAQEACTATPPIVPAEPAQYCDFNLRPGFCAATPKASALEMMAAHYPGTFCGCVYDPNNKVWSCGFVPKGIPGTCQTSQQPLPLVRFTRWCKQAAYYFIGGKCHAADKVAEDDRAAAAGWRIVRDANGNVLTLEQPIGNPVMRAGNYDAYGRPGYIDDGQIVGYLWAPNGSAYPEQIGGQGSWARFGWADMVRASRIDTGTVQATLKYRSNGTLNVLQEANMPQPHLMEVWIWLEDGTPVPPFWFPTTSAATADEEPLTSAAIGPGGVNIAPKIGVHQITILPAPSVFTIATVTAGATLLYPHSEPLLKLTTRWLSRCLSSSLADTPEERAEACTKQFNADIDLCESYASLYYSPNPKKGSLKAQLRGAFVAACRMSALARQRECEMSEDGAAGIKTVLDIRKL